MTNATPERQVESIQVPIAGLNQIYPAAVALSGFSGQPDSKWEEICQKHLEAECELCGIKLAGEELAQLSGAKSPADLPSSRLQRVQLHYCARNSCDSRFYRIYFRPHPNADWSQLKIRIQNSINLFPAGNQSSSTLASRFNGRLLLGIIFGVITGVVLLTLVHHWIYGGRIPIIQKRHYYTTETQPH